MICTDYNDIFERLLDNALDAESRRRLGEHLHACGDCRAEYEWLMTAEQDLQAMGDRIILHAPDVNVIDAVLQTEGVELLENSSPLIGPDGELTPF